MSKNKGYLVLLLFRLELIILLLMMIAPGTQGQWQAVSYRLTNTRELDLLRQAGSSPAIPFLFPETANKGCIRSERIRSDEEWLTKALDQFDWTHDPLWGNIVDVNDTIGFTYDQVRIMSSLFTKNIKKLLLVAVDRDTAWYVQESIIAKDGFQVPFVSPVCTWERKGGLNGLPEKVFLKRLAIVCQPVDPGTTPEIVIGDWRVTEVSVTPDGRSFAWIDSLSTPHACGYTAMFNDYSSWYYRRGSLPGTQQRFETFEDYGIENGYFSGYVTFKTSGKKEDEYLLLKRLIEKFVDLYPYYKERGLDKQEIQTRVHAFFNKYDGNYAALLSRLQPAFRSWYPDPHIDFQLPARLRKENTKVKNGPLRLRNMGGDVVVAAVLNDQYRDSIPLGVKVFSIDGKPVDAAVDPNSLLFRKEEDTLTISLAAENITTIRNFRIPYSVPVNVGRSFVPVPGIKMLPDSILLFRINHWLGDDYYQFLNSHIQYPFVKGMVIDLRANGGGYSKDVMRTLSLFTDESYSLGKYHYPWFDESLVIFPGKKEFRYPDNVKIVILVDKGTACASEIFLVGMRRRKNTLIMGDSRTMGAIASPTVFRFPSGLTVQLHTTFRQFVFDPGIYVEGQGIEPDVWVSRTHARDLAPYEDKMMQAALRVIRMK